MSATISGLLFSMLSHLSRSMGLLCSRNRRYNKQDTEENVQVNHALLQSLILWF